MNDRLGALWHLIGREILESSSLGLGAFVRPKIEFLERHRRTRVDKFDVDELHELFREFAAERNIDDDSSVWLLDAVVLAVGEHPKFRAKLGLKRGRGQPRKDRYARYEKGHEFLIHADRLKAIMQLRRGCKVSDFDLAREMELRRYGLGHLAELQGRLAGR